MSKKFFVLAMLTEVFLIGCFQSYLATIKACSFFEKNKPSISELYIFLKLDSYMKKYPNFCVDLEEILS